MIEIIKRSFRIVVLSLALALLSGISQTAAAAMLRVLVREESSASIPVAVTHPALLEVAGQAPTRLDPQKWHIISTAIPARIIPSNGGLVQVGNILYPGQMELRTWNGKSIAINTLDVEEYLRGVVPSEMPASWHLDALKAQAVAARSYAINTQRQRKWGNAPYDLVSDTRDQVYGGFYRFDPASGKTIPVTHARSDQAVAATSGLMLRSGFKGYYRARLQRNWVPWGNGYMPVADGQHLDQEMTNEMAKSGWRWDQILAWWYRDRPLPSGR